MAQISTGSTFTDLSDPEVPENKTVNCTGTAASSIRVPYYSAAAMMALVAAAVARRRGYIRLPFQDSPSRQH